MKIKIKKGGIVKSKRSEIIGAVEFYFNKLLNGNTRGLNVLIVFKRMPCGIGGRAFGVRPTSNLPYKIEVDKYSDMKEIFRVLAHECTHIKQYFLKELVTKFETKIQGGRLVRKRVRIWKGKEIRRSNYFKRGWEVEARRMEAMATSVKQAKKVELVPVIKAPIQPKPVAIASLSLIHERAIMVLECNKGIMRNDEFYADVLEVVKDSQERLQAQKEIYRLREDNIIEVYYQNSIAWVRLK